LKFAPWVRGVGYLLVVMKGITFVISVEMPPTDEVLLCATTNSPLIRSLDFLRRRPVLSKKTATIGYV
jgi:hypothetical protein